MNFNFNLEELLKIKSFIVYTFSVFSGTLLFLPDEWIQVIYLYHFKEQYGAEIGAGFLLSLIFSLGVIGESVCKMVHGAYEKRVALGKGKILELSPYEKKIVYSMYNRYNYTLNLRLYDGAVRHLQSIFIIEKIPGHFTVELEDLQNPATPYVLLPWVVKVLKKNPKVLDNIQKCYIEYETDICEISYD